MTLPARPLLLLLLSACGPEPELPSGDYSQSLRDSGGKPGPTQSENSRKASTESAFGSPGETPASGPSPGGSPFLFADASAGSGLEFVNVSGSMSQNFVLESMSAAAAFADYDGDGFLDLFAVNGTRLTDTPPGAGNRLFHSEPGPEGSGSTRRFREVEAGLGPPGWGMGCAAGDYDNDGDVDLYVTYWGPNRLYRNDGGEFAEVAAGAGVADRAGDRVPRSGTWTPTGSSICT